jgi:hypothetical protein
MPVLLLTLAWPTIRAVDELAELRRLEGVRDTLVEALKVNYERGASYDDETSWLVHYGLFYDDLPTEKWLDERHLAVLHAARALVATASTEQGRT